MTPHHRTCIKVASICEIFAANVIDFSRRKSYVKEKAQKFPNQRPSRSDSPIYSHPRSEDYPLHENFVSFFAVAHICMSKNLIWQHRTNNYVRLYFFLFFRESVRINPRHTVDNPRTKKSHEHDIGFVNEFHRYGYIPVA